MPFSKDFIWGAASAAYQVEGAYNEDGKGLNVWDEYSHQNGRIKHNENGDVACDHYHRYKEDVSLMKQMGIKYYRFSLSWARILPDGTGRINPKGVEFYNNLIDELIKNGIEPMVTLFHWDYPLALHRKGGWLNDESSVWFEEYAALCAKLFSDRVKYWMTINEPQCFIGCGYQSGSFAPFVKSSDEDLVIMTHNVLLAHGKAVRAIRNNAVREPLIGYAPTGPCVIPESDSPEDIEKARTDSFSVWKDGFTFDNVWWSDPMIFGEYNEKVREMFGDILNRIVKDGDMKIISEKLDFYGANVYWSKFIPAGDYTSNAYTGCPRSAMEWPVTDDALYWSSRFLYERYGLPILITENGIACHDWVFLDGKVYDPNRVDYLTRYLRGLKKAAEDGIPIIGYLYWSLMDNFEWADGYDKRFGLIHIDYRTQKRTIKESAWWYKHVIETNGEEL